MKYKERNKESETQRETHTHRVNRIQWRERVQVKYCRIHEHVVHKNDKFI